MQQTGTQQVIVWDPLVRIFHWSLVIFFLISYASAEEDALLHELTGYVVLGLVVIRIIWGFVGSHYARFSNFIYPPAAIVNYAKSLLSGSPKHYIGHNPLAGVMILMMLFMLIVVSYTGIMIADANEPDDRKSMRPSSHFSIGFFPAARADGYDDDDEDEDEFWEEIHEGSVNLMLLLVLGHIIGVLVSSHLHGEKLVRAMFTGRKNIGSRNT